MKTIGFAAMAMAGCLAVWAAAPAMAEPPVAAPISEHAKMLESKDPQLAANKKLVYDMYRVVLQGGHWERAGEFIRDDYIQHNPNVVNGLKALQTYIKNSRPAIPVEDKLHLPLISIIAERDRVVLNFLKPEKDANGKPYVTTWYDMFRIQDGKIAEHWDPALKSAAMLKFNPNSTRQDNK